MHARAGRVAQSAAVGRDRVSRAAVRRQVVRRERERRMLASAKATARRDRRHLAVFRRPVQSRLDQSPLTSVILSTFTWDWLSR